jgi:outer membrane protein assembly factor BamB
MVSSTPAIGQDGIIYVGSGDGNLYAINPSGKERWKFATGGEVLSSPALGSDGTIFVGSEDGNEYALNPDGTQKWKLTFGGQVSSSSAIGSDGTVYFGSDDHNLQWLFTNAGYRGEVDQFSFIYLSAISLARL